MLARRGEITAPCPVPLSLTATIPSSRMPAFSHFWIRRMMRLSPIRCSTKRMSQSLLILPCQAVHSRCRVLFEFEEHLFEMIRADVVEERGELILLPLPCYLPYALQPL